MTVGDLFKDALGLCNATEIDETPASTDMAVVKRTANIMLGAWAAQHLLLRADQELTVPTVAGTASYTVGLSGADVTAAKPIRVYGGYVVDGSMQYPLEVWAGGAFDTLQDQAASSGRPQYVAYDPGLAQQAAQKGTLRFYTTPDKVYSVKLQCQSYLTEFVNYTDTLTFEPVYHEALLYNLAARLFRRYANDQTPIPLDIVVIARDSLSVLKTLNAEPVRATLDLPGRPVAYNGYTDGY